MKDLYVRNRAFSDWAGLMNLLPDPDRTLRDKGTDVSLYRSLLYDAHVDACVTSREAGVLSCEYDFTTDSNRRSDKKALEFVRENFARLDMERLFRDILESVYFGFSVLEILTENDGTNVRFRDVVGRPQEWFVFGPGNELRFLSKQSPVDGEPVDMRRVELVRYRGSYRNPYGERKLARVFWPVSFKKGGWKFWLQFVEKYGGALLYLTTPEQDEDKNERKKEMLEEMIRTSVGVFSGQNDELNAVDVNKSGSSAAFRDLNSVCNAEISKAILGQTLTTEQGKTGAYSLGKVHFQVRKEIVDADKKAITATMNRLIRRLVEPNFDVETYPEFRFYEEEDVKKELAERDSVLTGLGVRFDKEYFVDNYNLDPKHFETGGESEPAPAEFAEDSDEPSARAEHGEFDDTIEGEKQFERLVGNTFKAFEASVTPLFDALKRAIDGSKDADDAMRNIAKAFAFKPDIENFAKSLRTADVLGRAQAVSSRRAEHVRERKQSSEFADAGSIRDVSDLKFWIDDYDEVDFLRMKVPMGREEFEALGETYRNYAFTVTGDFQESAISDVLTSLIDAKERKIPFKQWKEEWARVLPESRLGLVYRQNMRSAREAGRYAQMKRDVDVAPYWQYVAVMDKGTRPSHAALHRTIRRHDDPFWDEWVPPNGFNCRCSVRSLSPEYLRAHGMNPDDFDGNQGMPDFKEIARNNANEPGFEQHLDRLNIFDRSGRMIATPDAGFANNPGKDLWHWLKIKQTAGGANWAKIVKDKVDLRSVLRNVSPREFSPFDTSGEIGEVLDRAKTVLKSQIPNNTVIDPYGKPVYFDIDRIIEHIIDPKKMSLREMERRVGRLEYLNLIKTAVESPDAVVLNILEASGKLNIKGMTKLDRNYVVKLDDGKFFVVAANLSKEYPEFTGWTFMLMSKGMPGILLK